jgi:hypothetical protein
MVTRRKCVKSGTKKENFSRSIFKRSQRRGRGGFIDTLAGAQALCKVANGL